MKLNTPPGSIFATWLACAPTQSASSVMSALSADCPFEGFFAPAAAALWLGCTASTPSCGADAHREGHVASRLRDRGVGEGVTSAPVLVS